LVLQEVDRHRDDVVRFVNLFPAVTQAVGFCTRFIRYQRVPHSILLSVQPPGIHEAVEDGEEVALPAPVVAIEPVVGSGPHVIGLPECPIDEVLEEPKRILRNMVGLDRPMSVILAFTIDTDRFFEVLG
jgi:hypothetical protein